MRLLNSSVYFSSRFTTAILLNLFVVASLITCWKSLARVSEPLKHHWGAWDNVFPIVEGPQNDPKAPDTVKPPTPTHQLQLFLEQRGIHASHDKTILVTLASDEYTTWILNLVEDLEQDLIDSLLVYCMDEKSHEALKDRIPLAYYDPLSKQVAATKFTAINGLLALGYHVLSFDADIVINPGHDLFKGMLPLSEKWDQQIQPDCFDCIEKINFGLLWIRNNERNKAFWIKVHQKWKESQAWDQWVVNQVWNDMTAANDAETPIIKWLDNSAYVNLMLTEWQQSFGQGETLRHKLFDRATAVHMTCVEGDLKGYLAREFGLWSDENRYYSKPPPLLSIGRRMSGRLEELHRLISTALVIARDTGRVLVLPLWMDFDDAGGNVLPRHPYQLFHQTSLSGKTVETSYLTRRQELGFAEVPATQIQATDAEAMLEEVYQLRSAHLIMNPKELSSLSRTAARASPVELKICETVVAGESGTATCLRACGGPRDLSEYKSSR